jgi:hypothetical protein
MYLGYERLRDEVGYTATRFKQMLDEHGGVDTARLLLEGTTHSDGLDRLWTARRLDMSVEAIVLKPAYDALFTDDERATARFRLESYRFDVDAYLRSL